MMKYKVDKNEVSYHVEFLKMYLNDLKEGIDRLPDMEYHLSRLRTIFTLAEPVGKDELKNV